MIESLDRELQLERVKLARIMQIMNENWMKKKLKTHFSYLIINQFVVHETVYVIQN
jgi:glycine cleavage system protein P-like pyridoxal-binding family